MLSVIDNGSTKKDMFRSWYAKLYSVLLNEISSVTFKKLNWKSWSSE